MISDGTSRHMTEFQHRLIGFTVSHKIFMLQMVQREYQSNHYYSYNIKGYT